MDEMSGKDAVPMRKSCTQCIASGILNRLACAEMSLGAAGKSACATKSVSQSIHGGRLVPFAPERRCRRRLFAHGRRNALDSPRNAGLRRVQKFQSRRGERISVIWWQDHET